MIITCFLRILYVFENKKEKRENSIFDGERIYKENVNRLVYQYFCWSLYILQEQEIR